MHHGVVYISSAERTKRHCLSIVLMSKSSIMTDTSMKNIDKCDTVEELSELAHRADPENRLLAHRIYDRFCRLTDGRKDIKDFGPPDFFDKILEDECETEGTPHPSDDTDEEVLFLTPEEYAAEYKDEDGAPPSSPPQDYYTLTPLQQLTLKRFRTVGMKFGIAFKNMDQAPDAGEVVLAALDEALRRAGDHGTWASITISHPSIEEGPIYIRFQNIERLHAESILREMLRVMQSNKNFKLDDKLTVEMALVTPPQGEGRKRPAGVNYDEWREQGRCTIKISNDDQLCLARSVVVAKARVDDHPQKKTIQDSRKIMQKRMAQELMEQAGLKDHVGPCGMPELNMIQEFLAPDYQIKVFSRDDYDAMVYQGTEKADKVLTLHLDGNHYDVITKLPAFLEAKFFCQDCNRGYEKKAAHRCEATCPCCYERPKCQQDDTKQDCADCKRTFANQACFDNHKKERIITNRKKERVPTSVCTRVKRCEACKLQWTTDKKHHCNQYYCAVCCKHVDRSTEHRCFIQPIVPKKEDQGVKGWIFFDFETSQDTEYERAEKEMAYEHRVNLAIAQKACPEWIDEKKRKTTCQGCGVTQFSGDNCLENFCEWLFSHKHKGFVAFSHNGQGFDNHFILQYLHKNTIKPQVICQGLKIISLEAEGVKLLDSLAFLPMPLAALPKAFQLEELAKGYFPHLFNKAENWDVKQQGLPDIKYYGPETMGEEKRKIFEQWYTEHRGDHFDFRSEITRYCESDVQILREAVAKFRSSFVKATGVDPFQTSITIASACMEVYRTNFLKPNSIGVIPHGGYRYKYNFSNIGIQWVKWESQQRGIRIQHAKNGGEVSIGKKRVDGICDKTVFEFNGCAVHGCEKCFPDRDRKLPLAQNITAHAALVQTRMRASELRQQGYTVVEKWECDFRREIREDPELRDFIKECEVTQPLDPRDAFFGGRTNATKLYHKCAPGEEIHYVDVCSLYPWVCKYGSFPTGHPLIYTEGFEPISKDQRPYHGLIKCRILPPQDLYHPLLPLRTGKGADSKLTFPLCQACGERRSQTEPCTHTDAERALDGAWPTPEIYKALELGYRILKIHEVWNYENWETFDGRDEDTGLFTRYINTFLKLKTQASGWPAWVKTDADKDRFIREFEEREGIQLEADKIEKNPAFRALAKLCLNSFWGKWGQGDNLKKTEYFTEPDKYFACIMDPANDVKTIRIISDTMVMVSYTKTDEFIELQRNSNTALAALVTSQARLKLYSYLEKLGERCFYFDTDSLIYIKRDGDEYSPPLGSFLGDLTDELEGFGARAYICEFASAGPKNYAFQVLDPDTGTKSEVCKIRGFTLNSAAANKLNFKALVAKVKAFVAGNAEEEIVIHYMKISRQADRKVITEHQSKKYRVVYQKRMVLPDYNTLPYGYKK